MAIIGLGVLTICLLHIPAFDAQQRFTNQTLQTGLLGCNFQNFCSTTFDSTASTGINGSCCNKCFCSEDCWLFGDCCPDAKVPMTPSRFGDVIPVCFPNHLSIFGYGSPKSLFYRMITKCPYANTINNQTRQLCEDPFGNNFSKFDFSMRDIVPVSDNGWYVFRNIHCARCHGITDVHIWKLAVHGCSMEIDFEAAAGYIDTMFLVNNCPLYATPPDGANVYRSYCYSRAISSCRKNNVDQDIKDACHFSTFPVKIEVVWRSIVYLNIFCLLCNEQDPEMPIFCSSMGDDERDVLSSYQYMFDFDLSSRIMEVKPGVPLRDGRCSSEQIYDPYMNLCRNLKCNFAQTPEHGVCVQSGFHWHSRTLFLLLLLTVEDIEISAKLANVKQLHGHGFEPLTTAFINTLGLADACEACKENSIYSSNTEKGFFIKLGLQFSRKCTYKRIEEAVTYLKGPIVKNKVLLDENDTATITYRLFPTPNVGNAIFTTNECKGYTIKKLHHCPYIVLNETEFCIWQGNQVLSSNGTCISSLDVFENNSIIEVFVDGDYITIGVCLHEYLTKLVQESTNIAGILSLACTCLSMFCTFITVLMIWCRQQTKSLPMLILIVGMVNHFVAQGLFQFGNDWPDLKYICPVIGGLIHYFWLATVFAFNAYCVSVYHSLRQTNIYVFTRRVVLLFVCYIFILPLVFIATNVIYSTQYSDEMSILPGYGHIHCFIDSNLMSGVIFAAPILTTVLATCIVYLGIVYLVQKQVHFSKSVGIRTHYATSYFRLLVLTGVTWLIGYLNEIFPSDALGYIFIVCFGCQGVFVLLAFGYRSKQRTRSVIHE